MLIIAPAPNFDSFVSESYADDYASKMGLQAWIDYTGDKAILLRRGTQYLRAKYNPPKQYYDPSVHANLQQATVEAAVRSIDGGLLSDVNRAEIIKREKIDVLETEYAISDDFTGDLVSYPIIDQLMSELTGGFGNVFLLERL